MAIWHVYGAVAGTKYLGKHEAETEQEAIELAMSAKGSVTLCHACTCECEDAGIIECTAEVE